MEEEIKIPKRRRGKIDTETYKRLKDKHDQLLLAVSETLRMLTGKNEQRIKELEDLCEKTKDRLAKIQLKKSLECARQRADKQRIILALSEAYSAAL